MEARVGGGGVCGVTGGGQDIVRTWDIWGREVRERNGDTEREKGTWSKVRRNKPDVRPSPTQTKIPEPHLTAALSSDCCG